MPTRHEGWDGWFGEDEGTIESSRLASVGHPNSRLRASRERAGLARPELAERVAAWVYEHTGRVVAVDSHYVAKLERGSIRWPNADYRAALRHSLNVDTDAAIGLHLPAHPLPESVTASVDQDTGERITLAAASPRRTDHATVTAIADVLSATRRLEDTVGVAAVLPTVRSQLALADGLLAGCRSPVRERMAAVTGEMHQYIGWLLKASGDSAGAHQQLDTALALAVEIDHPDLVSMALSFKGTTALDDGDAASAVTLSRAAVRDERVFVAQHAYNAFQEARGHGLGGDATAVEEATARGEHLAERAVDEQDNAPDGQYWYGAGFFTVQRGLAWHALRGSDHARRAAETLEEGIADLPADERESEWATGFSLSAAEAHADSGDLERAAHAARRVLTVARSAGSAPLTSSVQRLRDDWSRRYPGASAGEDLSDGIDGT